MGTIPKLTRYQKIRSLIRHHNMAIQKLMEELNDIKCGRCGVEWCRHSGHEFVEPDA